jgi:hypothetical protein
MKLCTPALVYLVLSVIGLFLGSKMFTVIHILGILLWTFILNYLCSIGLKTVSWILVLLPVIIMFGFIFMALGIRMY